MRINHNSMALNASDHFAKINNNIAKSMSRLSSGKKITSPSDDAAGLAISTKLDAQIKGLDRAALNSNDGISVIQSAEGGLDEMHRILARMRELAVKAAEDVNSEEDRDAIQEEINALEEEINQIADTTAFNGQKLLNGGLARRSLSSDGNMKATYISKDVNPGIYELEITQAATQAVLATGITNSGATVGPTEEGMVKVNGFEVKIEEGMSMTEVFEELQAHLTKIGVDVIASPDGGKTSSDFTTGDPVYFVTKEYGLAQTLDLEVIPSDLEALLGITSGTSVTGTDCEAAITSTTNGFSQTATFTTKGNEVNIIDRNGFEMTIETLPDQIGATEVEVLSAGTMVIQIGANSGEQIELDIPKVDSEGLGVDNLIMYTHAHAAEAIERIDAAIKKVSNIRSGLGAYENRLNDTYDSLKIQSESITEAYSRIMDTDMAEEMTNYTQQDVLAQAAISMMQRSNERPESILQLLQ